MQQLLSAVGPAPPELAWRRYTHPALWSQWSPQIRRVDCDDETLTGASRGRVHGPPGVAVDFEVTALDQATMTWAWQVRLLVVGVSLGLHHGVQAHPEGSRTWLRLDGPAPVVLGYAPVARWALGRLVSP